MGCVLYICMWVQVLENLISWVTSGRTQVPYNDFAADCPENQIKIGPIQISDIYTQKLTKFDFAVFQIILKGASGVSVDIIPNKCWQNQHFGLQNKLIMLIMLAELFQGNQLCS